MRGFLEKSTSRNLHGLNSRSTCKQIFALLKTQNGPLKHRSQIFKMVGVKFDNLFLCTEWHQRNCSYFTVNLPLDVSEIFKFSDVQCFSSFLRIQENFGKNIKTVEISKPVDERSNIFQENHSLWMSTI